MERDGPSALSVARTTVVVLVVLLLAYGLYVIRDVLVLVVVALFFAIGLDPVVRSLNRRGLKRSLAVGVVLVIALLVIGGFVAAVTPPLARQTVRLAQQIPDFAHRLSDRSSRFAEWDAKYHISKKLKDAIKDVPKLLAGSTGKAVGFVKSIGGALFNIVTVIVLTIYFLLDLPKLVDGGAKLFAKSRREEIQRRSEVVFNAISSYLLGNIATSAVAGVVSLIALSLLHVPYALPLALWVAIADLIPLVGATIGAVPAVIVGLFHGVPTGIETGIFFVAYQQFENYVVQPRVMRQAVNISAAAVLLAALIGATLLGFVGALLAIPIAASTKVLVQEIWFPRQDAA